LAFATAMRPRSGEVLGQAAIGLAVDA